MLLQYSVDGSIGSHKSRILHFVSQFDDAVFLDSNMEAQTGIPFTGTRYSYIAAAGVTEFISYGKSNLEDLQQFVESRQQNGEWVFGYLTYDLKNEIEQLISANPDHAGFPLFHFFSARHVFLATDTKLEVLDAADPESLWERIISMEVPSPDNTGAVHISHVLNRDYYFQSLEILLNHIQKGDIYEINFCHEILAESQELDPVNVFRKLNTVSPNPFSCYVRSGRRHLMCASPERFVARRGTRIISQPMKGTAPRGNDTPTDMVNRNHLAASEKERSENVMIVDLVRNDLSKVAQPGTVRVEELFGIYTFPKIHQMISTVSCEIMQNKGFTDVIKALFPMGSMTGAPKVSAMKLIEQHENFRRSLFSGSVGYISPDGDFDFNVVIRSILYNEETGVVSTAAGGAITALSNPEQEYNETLLKLGPQLESLGLNAEQIVNAFSDGSAA